MAPGEESIGPGRVLVDDVAKPIGRGAEVIQVAEKPVVDEAEAPVFAAEESLIGIRIELIDGVRTAGCQRVAVEHVDETGASLKSTGHDVHPALLQVAVEA